jgi:hypothetical protein
MLFAEGNAIKYICRHSKKNKAEDIKKAIHYLEMILERDYKKRSRLNLIIRILWCRSIAFTTI